MTQPSRAPGGGSGGMQTGKAVLVIAVVVVVGWVVLRHGTNPHARQPRRPPTRPDHGGHPRDHPADDGGRWWPPPTSSCRCSTGC